MLRAGDLFLTFFSPAPCVRARRRRRGGHSLCRSCCRQRRRRFLGS